MRIATWNVNALRARMDFFRHWLDARKPDIVGLQELKMTDERFPAAEFEALGYHSAVHGQKAWNGVAVLSRRPLAECAVGLPGQEALGARLLSVTVGDLEFTTIYCPNGKSLEHEDFPRKLAWLDALAQWFASAGDPGRAAVLAGDFNICPAPEDSWNEQLAGTIFHTVEERTRLGRLYDLGLIDLYRAVHPQGRQFSWWDYRRGAFHRNQGLRIDLLLGTEAVRRRVRNVETDRDYRKKKEGMIASDHAPVIAELA